MTNNNNIPTYSPKGHIVKKRTKEEIIYEAVICFSSLNEHKISLDNIEGIVDILSVNPKFNISIHIEKNTIWDKIHSSFKKGESIPSKRCIVLPKRVFDGIKKGKRVDLEILFHEIGHVVLNHEPVYMKSNGYILTELDDAEVQADYFAEVMLKLFAITREIRMINYNQQLGLF